VATRKSFLLRLDQETYEALARWAGDDLRSVNGQLEFLLRRALGDAGRLPGRRTGGGGGDAPGSRRRTKVPPGA